MKIIFGRMTRCLAGCLVIMACLMAQGVSHAQTTYSADRAYIARWLLQRQITADPTKPGYGAIRLNADPFAYEGGRARYRVVLYRSNIAVMSALYSHEPGAVPFAERHVRWTMSHLTPTSAPAGVPNDHIYDADGSNEQVVAYLDGTEAAIATTFSALWATYQASDSKAELSSDSYRTKVDQLVTTLSQLKDESDGLYWTKANYHIKFFEGQNEVWAGLRDVALLYKNAFKDSTKAALCGERANELQAAIVSNASSQFFNRFGDGLYSPSKDGDGNFFDPDLVEPGAIENPGSPEDPGDARGWYSSTQAAMWGVLWGTVGPNDNATKVVVKVVNSYWDGSPNPNWPTSLGTPAIDQGLINSSFALAMFRAGEKTKAATYLGNIKALRYPNATTSDPAPIVANPFNCDDAGWLLMLLSDAGDRTTPTVAITTPLADQVLTPNSFAAITGTASDDVNLSQVLLTLSRTRNGLTQYWDGAAFTSAEASIPVALETGGATSTDWNYLVTPQLRSALDGGAYTVYAYAKDAAGNQSPVVERVFNLELPTLPDLSINDVTVTEGNGGSVNANFIVKLSAPSSQTVKVSFATADGTAKAPGDYSTRTGPLSFAPGETTKAASISVKGDTLNEGNEQFQVKLSNATNASVADGTGVGTIVDDDGPPSLSINSPQLTEGNSGQKTLNFTVKLSKASGKAVAVNCKTDKGALDSATAGVDYLALPTTKLTFAPGETTKTVSVKINGDTLDEADEHFKVLLSGASNATISESTGVGTILDDDVSPSLSINDVTITEGNKGSKTAVFTVTLSSGSGRNVSVNFATAGGSALEGSDYQRQVGTLLFTPGQTSKTISVTINGDTVRESDEGFKVQLSASSGAKIADGTGMGTILNDDSGGTSALSSSGSSSAPNS